MNRSSAACLWRARLVLVGGFCLTASAGTSPTYVMHEVSVTLDQVEPAGRSKVGDVDHLRIVYDRHAVDPRTRRVALLNFQHLIDGAYRPEHPDPVFMPMNDAWLDLSSRPYRLHFRAAVVHGKPILIEVDENTHRLTIHPQGDSGAVLLSGTYRVDPRPITGAAARAAASSAAR